MGMPVITPGTGTRCQAITDIIESVALEEAALSHILNAEGEKLQKIIAQATTATEMLNVNKSVESMVGSVTRLEMILQSKLELFKDCLCTDCNSTCTRVTDTNLTWIGNPGVNTITKIDKNNYQVLTVSEGISMTITTTPNVPLSVISIDPSLSLSGNILTIDYINPPGPVYATIQMGEGACAETLNIEVVYGG